MILGAPAAILFSRVNSFSFSPLRQNKRTKLLKSETNCS